MTAPLCAYLESHGWIPAPEIAERLRARGCTDVVAVFGGHREGRSRFVAVYRDDRNELDVRPLRELGENLTGV